MCVVFGALNQAESILHLKSSRGDSEGCVYVRACVCRRGGFVCVCLWGEIDGCGGLCLRDRCT